VSGERAALQLVLDQQHEEADEDDRQFGLFGPALSEAGQAKQLAKRGPGRPPGARNKRTERTVAFLLSRHRDPRQVLLEIAEANVADLAALYGCSLFEAGQEKRLAAAAVLPYIAQRQPLAIDVTKRSVVYLTINDGAFEETRDDGIGIAAQVVQIQQLSDVSASDVGRPVVGQLEQANDIAG
jgi:hypothetical protein